MTAAVPTATTGTGDSDAAGTVRATGRQKGMRVGIRLNHAIGYGLVDVRTEDGRIVDERIDPYGIVAQPYRYRHGDALWRWIARRARFDPDDEGSFDRLMAAAAAVGGQHQRRVALRPDRSVHAPEGAAFVLLTPPTAVGTWNRYDDELDYYALDPSDTSPTVRQLDTGPYPYDGHYVDAATGSRVLPAVVRDLRHLGRMLDRADLDGTDRQIAQKVADNYAVKLGYRDHAHATETIVPGVPSEIVDLATWGHAFTRPDVIRQLRPLHVSYYS